MMKCTWDHSSFFFFTSIFPARCRFPSKSCLWYPPTLMTILLGDDLFLKNATLKWCGDRPRGCRKGVIPCFRKFALGGARWYLCVWGLSVSTELRKRGLARGSSHRLRRRRIPARCVSHIYVCIYVYVHMYICISTTRVCARVQRCSSFLAMEAIANVSWVLREHRAGCRFRPPSCPFVELDALLLAPWPTCSLRNPSKSTLAHDAVAAVVLHEHHLIICVGAGLIQFVYGSHSRMAADLTLDKIYFCCHFRGFLYIYIYIYMYIHIVMSCMYTKACMNTSTLQTGAPAYYGLRRTSSWCDMMDVCDRKQVSDMFLERTLCVYDKRSWQHVGDC